MAFYLLPCFFLVQMIDGHNSYSTDTWCVQFKITETLRGSLIDSALGCFVLVFIQEVIQDYPAAWMCCFAKQNQFYETKHSSLL